MDRTRLWSTLEKGLAAVLQALGGTALLLLMLHSVANSLSRKWFDFPLAGTTEYAGMWYLAGIAFAGCVVAQRGREHIEVRLLFDRLPRTHQKDLTIFAYLLSVGVLAVLTWSTLTEAMHNLDIGLTAGVTGVVVWPVTFLPPFAFAVLSLYALSGLLRTATTRGIPVEATEADEPSPPKSGH
ncbi:hypothetical protein GCM10009676_39200 [Prauserella halophila]|uniref:Tripartite ATP-independent periplasmic transporters DctQ component domain-containing protein n=1 Tax=Prauserella halophila TaxID=185641 RepID=A0ABP4H5I4_9PSEU|nr:TRAP transporter small permease [Prauserella halophila]MCP2238187.1 TRAP-type C4-dicarboxylate transport system, small permease component [Prauserella halophila]